MCTIQLNYAYSREREHDVYIETTSFIYCIYWLLVFHSENSFESIITLQTYKAAHQIDNQLITFLNINFWFCYL